MKAGLFTSFSLLAVLASPLAHAQSTQSLTYEVKVIGPANKDGEHHRTFLISTTVGEKASINSHARLAVDGYEVEAAVHDRGDMETGITGSILPITVSPAGEVVTDVSVKISVMKGFDRVTLQNGVPAVPSISAASAVETVAMRHDGTPDLVRKMENGYTLLVSLLNNPAH